MTAAAQPQPDCDAPARVPTRARQRLPAGTCDSHLHVFGPHARYPLDARRNYTPHECSLEDYRQVMQAVGIERAVLVQTRPTPASWSTTWESCLAWCAGIRFSIC
jgi:hypothetical protein